VLHLSYHDGEHYNSVRAAGDYSPGPPEPITQLLPLAHAGEVSACTAGRTLQDTAAVQAAHAA
jgi:OTU domain-containing protein 3